MTEPSTRTDRRGKGERALQLLEKGLSHTQIAQRLGGNASSISTLISNARKARAKRAMEAAR